MASGSPVAAIILAAGRSSRMGRSKALLTHATAAVSFVTHLIGQLRAAGLSHVLVVGRGGDEDVRAEVTRAGATFVVATIPANGDDGVALARVAGFVRSCERPVLFVPQHAAAGV